MTQLLHRPLIVFSANFLAFALCPPLVFSEGAVNRAQTKQDAVVQQVIQQRQMQQQQMMLKAQQERQMAMRQRAIQQKALLEQKHAVEQRRVQDIVRQQQAAFAQMRQRKASVEAAVQQQKQQIKMAQASIAKERAIQEAALMAQSRAAQTAMLQNNTRQRYQMESARETWDRVNSQTVEEIPEEVVGLKEIWEELTISSEVWPLIMDMEPKRLTIDKYIQWYREQGIMIRKDSVHYVELIDGMSKENSSMLKQPFSIVMKFVAIIEYDFDNGQDGDRIAKQVLGEKMHMENRKRLGM